MRRKDKWSETVDWLYMRTGPFLLFAPEICTIVMIFYVTFCNVGKA